MTFWQYNPDDDTICKWEKVEDGVYRLLEFDYQHHPLRETVACLMEENDGGHSSVVN